MDEKRADDLLFEAKTRDQRKKKRRKILRTLIILGVAAFGLVWGSKRLTRRVEQYVQDSGDTGKSFTAEYGPVYASVTGSGPISDVEPEEISVPAGVEIDEIVVESGDKVQKGDLLATVKMASVSEALTDIQARIKAKDRELLAVSNSKEEQFITAGVKGRVKTIYAQAGVDVAACMTEHGALAVISQDGWMCVTIEASNLKAGDKVKVQSEPGAELEGKVDNVRNGQAVILVSDKDLMPGDHVSLLSYEGETLGEGDLAIHNPVHVVGYSGTVKTVNVKVNQSVAAGARIFLLKDAEATAQYDKILRERETLEKTLLALLRIRQDGALCAPIDGTVLVVKYEEDEQKKTAEDEETEILTLSKDEEMSVEFSVNEMDILALEIGQKADIVIESVGKNQYHGTITEINKYAYGGADGKTSYSAKATFSKEALMLGGMTADVTINVDGSDHALRVPTEAIQKTSVSAYGYTGRDPQTGKLINPVTVTLGLSNSEYTEIRDGLQEGDTVYYELKQDQFSFITVVEDAPSE